MPRKDTPSRGLGETLVSSAARSSSGNSGSLGGFGNVEYLRVQLEVTAVSGTTPTLDVVLEDTVDGGANWAQVAAFGQKTAAGAQTISVTQPFSDTLRVRWTLGGTSPSFTFNVKVYSQ